MVCLVPTESEGIQARQAIIDVRNGITDESISVFRSAARSSGAGRPGLEARSTPYNKFLILNDACVEASQWPPDEH